MATYLDTILDAHRWAAAADRRNLDDLMAEARGCAPARGFAAALRRANRRGEMAVIAEVKRRSPSKGELAPGVDAATLAEQYVAGGAACLSVLTDEEFFGGSPFDLGEARDAVEVPVLRKDFTVSPADVCDARLMGADAVLLIAAALDDTELAEFRALAAELDIDALVEIHDEQEIERALAAGAQMIGINQRDLVSFAVDPERAVRLAPLLPDGVVRVAESGITGPDDARRLADTGFHALLVGETLVRAADPTAAVEALRVPSLPCS